MMNFLKKKNIFSKRFIFLLFSVILIGCLLWMYLFTGSPVTRSSTKEGGESVFLSARTTQDKLIDLDRYQGSVVIINFWATWCPPCSAEIPHLIKLQHKYRKKGLQIMGISLDSDISLISPFIKEKGINYPIILGETLNQKGLGDVTSIPTTFILDRNHTIVRKVLGYQSLEFFEDVLQPLL